MAPGCVGGEVTFEVHLPELIGCGVFEALERPMSGRFFGVDAAMAQKDLMNGAAAGKVLGAGVGQSAAQLASSPGRMAIA
jgi:hypothetical protein